MNYLERLDLNIDPFLAKSWLKLAWLQEFGLEFSEIDLGPFEIEITWRKNEN